MINRETKDWLKAFNDVSIDPLDLREPVIKLYDDNRTLYDTYKIEDLKQQYLNEDYTRLLDMWKDYYYNVSTPQMGDYIVVDKQFFRVGYINNGDIYPTYPSAYFTLCRKLIKGFWSTYIATSAQFQAELNKVTETNFWCKGMVHTSHLANYTKPNIIAYLPFKVWVGQ